MCHCGAVVKELLERAVINPGSTPGDAVFCFFEQFLLFGLFLNTIFPFGLFFFILIADPASHAIGSIYILLEKGFRKLLICIMAKLTTRKKP